MGYDYDLNGNQLEQNVPEQSCGGRNQRDMTYDAGNRMTQAVTQERSGGTTRTITRKYWYDGLGRRILTHVTSVGGSGSPPKDLGLWRYWWFDENVAVKTWNYTTDDVVANLDWPHMLRTNDTLHGYGEWFYYGPGPDNLLASWGYKNPQAATTKQHLFLPDWRGSVTQVTDSAGNNLGLSASAYMAFGGESGSSGSAAELNPGYNGHESSGGLVYMRNRWYDPNTGRFTQEDPIGYAGGINLYGFAGNDPVSYSDPFGLCPWCIVGAAWAIYEVGSAIYDVVKAARTVADPDASTSEKVVTVGLAAASIIGPGGGYTAGARQVSGILREGGELIGRAGAGRGVREVTGGVDDARSMFAKLTKGAEVSPHPRVEGGQIANLPGGGTVGFRPSSRSGPATIDVNVPEESVKKIKFIPDE